eukprot:103597-Chlamydomonas_euryale.AAC.11
MEACKQHGGRDQEAQELARSVGEGAVRQRGPAAPRRSWPEALERELFGSVALLHLAGAGQKR